MEHIINLARGGCLRVGEPPRDPRGCVLICPGGGYEWRSPREADPVARAFAEKGFAPAVLEYTCYRGEPLGTLPLTQLGEAAGRMRELYPGRLLAVCGFSAGGHLAASLGVHARTLGLPRPDALILGYPVITAGAYAHRGSIRALAGDGDAAFFSLEAHVNAQTPPTFLWHTSSDESVPVQNSLLFAEALARAGVPFELHIYPEGVHGLSLATPEVDEPQKRRLADAHVASWFGLCADWLNHLLKE